MKRFLTIAVAAMATVMTFTMCNTKTEKIPVNSTWKLEKFTTAESAVTIPVEATVTVSFLDSARLSGCASCNSYFGDYKVGDDGSVTLNPVGMTRMACPFGIDENQYVNALAKLNKYTITGETLTMFNDKEGITMVFSKEIEK